MMILCFVCICWCVTWILYFTTESAADQRAVWEEDQADVKRSVDVKQCCLLVSDGSDKTLDILLKRLTVVNAVMTRNQKVWCAPQLTFWSNQNSWWSVKVKRKHPSLDLFQSPQHILSWHYTCCTHWTVWIYWWSLPETWAPPFLDLVILCEAVIYYSVVRSLTVWLSVVTFHPAHGVAVYNQHIVNLFLRCLRCVRSDICQHPSTNWSVHVYV